MTDLVSSNIHIFHVFILMFFIFISGGKTQSFPTSFPCMWPSEIHLGLDLVDAQYVFQTICMHVRLVLRNMFKYALPCDCRTWTLLDPDVWRIMWVVFLIKLCYTCFDKSCFALFWKVLDLAWMTIPTCILSTILFWWHFLKVLSCRGL